MLSILADALMLATRQKPFGRKPVEYNRPDHYEENRQRAFDLFFSARN
jgi:hypothetical protein